MLADLVEVILAKIGRWLHWNWRGMVEGTVRSGVETLGERLSRFLPAWNLPAWISDPVEKCLPLLLWLLSISLLLAYYLGFVDFFEPNQLSRSLGIASGGLALSLCILSFIWRLRQRWCGRAEGWLMVVIVVIVIPSAVTLFWLEHRIEMAVWFALRLSFWATIIVTICKSMAAFQDHELTGFLWAIPLVAFLVVSYSFGSAISERTFSYKRNFSRYFLYGQREWHSDRLAVVPTGRNYEGLLNEVGEALKQCAQKVVGATPPSDAQLRAIVENAYIRPFRRRGAEVESTLVSYSRRLSRGPVREPDREVMLGIIMLCTPNLYLLEKAGVVSGTTAADAKRVTTMVSKKP